MVVLECYVVGISHKVPEIFPGSIAYIGSLGELREVGPYSAVRVLFMPQEHGQWTRITAIHVVTHGCRPSGFTNKEVGISVQSSKSILGLC